MCDASNPQRRSLPPLRGAPLLGYIEEMLLELAHMAAAGDETAVAGTLAVAAIQCGGQLKATLRREAEEAQGRAAPLGRPTAGDHGISFS